MKVKEFVGLINTKKIQQGKVVLIGIEILLSSIWVFLGNFRIEDVNQKLPFMSQEPLSPVPYNLTLFKGSKNIIISRKTAHDALTHPVHLALRNWLKDTTIPDETFFPTIAKIVNITQTEENDYNVVQKLDTFDTSFGICPRASMWQYPGAPKCYGGYVHNICQLTVQDLCKNILLEPSSQNCLIANKFRMSVDAKSVLLVFYLQ